MRIGNASITIANKKRAIISLVFVMLLIMSLIITLPLTKVNGEEDQKMIEYVVQQGDTIWSISQKFDSKTGDIREKIYEICKLNEKSNEYIYVGETLMIPVD